MIKFYILALCFSLVQAEVVYLSVLNKISAKKKPLIVNKGEQVSIHDLILSVDNVRHEKDSFEGDVDCARISVHLNQGEEVPILLYQGEIRSTQRYPQTPLDHPLYDIILDYVKE